MDKEEDENSKQEGTQLTIREESESATGETGTTDRIRALGSSLMQVIGGNLYVSKDSVSIIHIP
jgi:hypothetical protein